MVYNNNEIYDGVFLKGQRNGYGVLTFANKDKYVGNWIKDI